MSRAWSKQQLDIFDWFSAGTGNLVVRARAGTGKTTTIVEAVRKAPESSIMLCAFNKRIAAELQTRLTGSVADAATLHSIGFRFVGQNMKATIDANHRANHLTAAAIGPGSSAGKTVLRQLTKLHTLGREASPFATEEDLFALAVEHEIECSPPEQVLGYTQAWLAEHAFKAMEIARATDPHAGKIDFADMIFLPLAKNLTRPMYELVVVDEAQDMNLAQLTLAQRICSGRIAVVGDDRQAIYGFRGADSGSLDRLLRELKATEMGLTTTYRCGKAIVELARRYVGDFEAGPNNPEGKVAPIMYDNALAGIKAGDFMLSRRNAPLARACLAMLRDGRKARIEGKDLAANLQALARGLARDAFTMEHFWTALSNWSDQQGKALMARYGNDEAKLAARIEDIRDREDVISAFAQSVKTPAEVEQRIAQVFADDGTPSIVLSSIHRSKGLEADGVYVLTDSFNSKYAGEVEEQNLHYVAYTRAKQFLGLVEGTPGMS